MHLKKINELEMWYRCGLELLKIPNDYRSSYHTYFLNEVTQRISDQVDVLKLKYSDWDIYNHKTNEPSSEITLMGSFKSDAS
jgi:hypothetical protein